MVEKTAVDHRTGACSRLGSDIVCGSAETVREDCRGDVGPGVRFVLIAERTSIGLCDQLFVSLIWCCSPSLYFFGVQSA